MNIVILWAAYSSFYTHVKHRYFFSMAHLLTASVKREAGNQVCHQTRPEYYTETP